MGNGEWEIVVSAQSAQYGEETRTARGKRKMEGKIIYLQFFPRFWNYWVSL